MKALEIECPFKGSKSGIAYTVYRYANGDYTESKLAYQLAGKRKLETFSDFESAKKRGDAVCEGIAQGDHATLTLRPVERQVYERALKFLKPSGAGTRRWGFDRRQRRKRRNFPGRQVGGAAALPYRGWHDITRPWGILSPGARKAHAEARGRGGARHHPPLGQPPQRRGGNRTNDDGNNSASSANAERLEFQDYGTDPVMQRSNDRPALLGHRRPNCWRRHPALEQPTRRASRTGQEIGPPRRHRTAAISAMFGP